MARPSDQALSGYLLLCRNISLFSEDQFHLKKCIFSCRFKSPTDAREHTAQLKSRGLHPLNLSIN